MNTKNDEISTKTQPFLICWWLACWPLFDFYKRFQQYHLQVLWVLLVLPENEKSRKRRNIVQPAKYRQKQLFFRLSKVVALVYNFIKTGYWREFRRKIRNEWIMKPTKYRTTDEISYKTAFSYLLMVYHVAYKTRCVFVAICFESIRLSNDFLQDVWASAPRPYFISKCTVEPGV